MTYYILNLINKLKKKENSLTTKEIVDLLIYRNIFLYDNEKEVNYRWHNFHLVSFSFWPFFASISVLLITIGTVMYLHFYKYGFFVLCFGFYFCFFFFFFCFFFLFLVLYFWWLDVIDESMKACLHSFRVVKNFRYGMILFIISEVMFFFAFFWAFFHSSLSPSIWIGGIWPPIGIPIIDPFRVPLLNTLILVVSGITLTWSHVCLKYHLVWDVLYGLILTILLAILFLYWQFIEYSFADFYIFDGIYGSTFYMTTGFHGFHVIIGTIWLIISFLRMWYFHFYPKNHFGFEACIWYWHFVDVVWLLVYLFIYCWGSGKFSNF